jgi:ATP-dependent DNA helicase RecQ
LRFEEVHGLCGVPGRQDVDSLALTILRCVNEMNGRYGRVRIARLLCGSTSRSVLTMSIDELRSYGAARGLTQKEILILIDWLIDEDYLQVPEDQQYPTLAIAPKGDQCLEDFETGAEIKLGHQDNSDTTVPDALRAWRRAKSEETGLPLYIILQNRTIEELAAKRPKTINDLKDIYGMGEAKIEQYGSEMLDVLNTMPC